MYVPPSIEQLVRPRLRRPLTCAILGMNCEKNAVVCEGYPEKQIWKSGKEKAAEGVFCTRLRGDPGR